MFNSLLTLWNTFFGIATTKDGIDIGLWSLLATTIVILPIVWWIRPILAHGFSKLFKYICKTINSTDKCPNDTKQLCLQFHDINHEFRIISRKFSETITFCHRAGELTQTKLHEFVSFYAKEAAEKILEQLRESLIHYFAQRGLSQQDDLRLTIKTIIPRDVLLETMPEEHIISCGRTLEDVKAS